MKVANLLFEKIIIQILVTLFIPIAAAIGSKLATGDWLEWFAAPKNLVWVILAIILWVVGSAIYRRIKHLREQNQPPVSLRFARSGGWKTIHKIKHAGVNWHVRIPVDDYALKDRERPTVSDLDIEIPPRCPECGTKIEETESFWPGYIWKCVKCGFHKRNRDSYLKEERRVTNLAERWFEEL